MQAITINFGSLLKLSSEQFLQLCSLNRDIRMERNAQGEIIVMPPPGAESGRCNANIIYHLYAWNSIKLTGVVFDSSTCFNLPNRADRSPDAAWISLECLNNLTETEKEVFAPICPDFIIELRSKTDNLKQLQAKLQEYLDNGLRLGWLIDPRQKIVEIYRQGKEVEVLEFPAIVSGEDVLPGFVLDLKGIFT